MFMHCKCWLPAILVLQIRHFRWLQFASLYARSRFIYICGLYPVLKMTQMFPRKSYSSFYTLRKMKLHMLYFYRRCSQLSPKELGLQKEIHILPLPSDDVVPSICPTVVIDPMSDRQKYCHDKERSINPIV